MLKYIVNKSIHPMGTGNSTPATPWALNGTPWDFGGSDLLPDDLDRLHGALEKGFARFPEVADAGIKRVVNGPFTFSPDGNPLVGPVCGLSNYWAACGVMAGFAQGGGIGLTLAQWMIDGQPVETPGFHRSNAFCAGFTIILPGRK